MQDGILSVAAKVSSTPAGSGSPIRLVVDRERGVIYGGPAKLFGREVPAASRLFELDVVQVELEMFSTGGLLKRWRMSIGLGQGTEPFAWLELAKGDAEAVLDAVRAWHERVARHAERQDRREALIDSFKAKGVVDLKAYVRENSHWLEQISDVGPAFSERTREAGDPAEWNAGVLLESLVTDLEQAIVEGRLSGVLDRDKGEYRDRDFIVREQRVVTVNVAIDFNALVTQLGGKGIALHGIECPGCGATTAGVPEGSYFVCQHCRSTVRAVDVFERFRGILG